MTLLLPFKACQLLSLEKDYPPAYQLALDMFKRLGQTSSDIYDVLLTKNHVRADLILLLLHLTPTPSPSAAAAASAAVRAEPGQGGHGRHSRAPLPGDGHADQGRDAVFHRCAKCRGGCGRHLTFSVPCLLQSTPSSATAMCS